MLRKIRQELGFFLRGLHGIYQNQTDKLLELPAGLEEIELGHSIKAYKFGNGAKKVLFMGGIHGNEVGTVKLMHRLINYLSQNKISEDIAVYAIPLVNNDGYQVAQSKPDYFRGGRLGRFNANNVDLNRNFPTKSFAKENIWGFGTKKVTVFCGDFPACEPETKILVDFIKNNEIKIIYSFHSRGKEVMGNNNELSQKLVKDYVENTGYNYVSDEKWEELKQTGTIKEWCDDNEIAYVEVEASTRWGSDWENQKSAIKNAMSGF